MSRTRRGAKGPGFEYWSRRGYPSVRMAEPGRESKRATHRQERRDDKQVVVDGLREAEAEPTHCAGGLNAE